MSIQSRVALYEKIETLRRRPLIVYATSPRLNASGKMGSDAVPEICDQIAALPTGTQKADLLIVSSGGDPMVAWRTISMLRETISELGVLVPHTAYSAATLLALGADEIVMHPFANLGPIDPQIDIQKIGKDGKSKTSTLDLKIWRDSLNSRAKELAYLIRAICLKYLSCFVLKLVQFRLELQLGVRSFRHSLGSNCYRLESAQKVTIGKLRRLSIG